MWVDGVYFLPTYLVLHKPNFKKTRVNDHSLRGWLRTCLCYHYLLGWPSCNLTWRVYSCFLCQFFIFFYQRKWLLCFSGIIHTPFIWNCLELDSDPLRGRVREYLQTIFKLGMYRYYLEKYILDHVLQIFRGAGIAIISVFNEGGKVKCISSRYSSLQRVIIGIKVRGI